jgi:hypothetical protein
MSERLLRHALMIGALLGQTAVLGGCVGNHTTAGAGASPPAQNKLALTVDSGPSGAPGQVNHAYVTVTVCVPGSKNQCVTVDHVLLDTGSSGLRLVGSVLSAGLSLSSETDSQGQTLEECVTFGGGQTWGPVVRADVTLAGEVAAQVPIQILDDTGTGAPPPSSCGANGTLLNTVSGFGANGVLGIGVFAQDCGSACAGTATPLPVYYGCSAGGACSAENAGLSAQVTNPVTLFAADNNGLIVNLPTLQNANGDVQIAGEVIFGLGTQADNALPAIGLVVLGTNANGDFTATYNGGATVLPALIDSGADAYLFDDPAMAVCASGAYVGYYCPAVAPQSVFAVNSGLGANNATSRVDFAIADPNSFVAGAAAFIDLGGGGGSTNFTWGMPFFYGRTVYVGFEQRAAGSYIGPYFAY